MLLATATASAQMPRGIERVEVPMQVFENGLYPAAFAIVEVRIGGLEDIPTAKMLLFFYLSPHAVEEKVVKEEKSPG